MLLPKIKSAAEAFILTIGFSCLLGTKSAQAAPTMALGSAAGLPGATVSIPVTFDPGGTLVASIQFDLVLPSALSTGSITDGDVLNNAGKSVSSNVSGTTWRFILFGLNQNTMSAGSLLNAQVAISPGAPGGSLNVPISNVIYADPNGNTIASGSNISGTVMVSGGSTTNPPPINLPTPDLSSLPDSAGLGDILTLSNYAAGLNVSFVWNFTPETIGNSIAVPGRAIASNAGTVVKSGNHTATLGSYGLGLGTYQVTVYAVDNTNPNHVSGTSSPKSLTIANTDFSALSIYPNPFRSDKPNGNKVTFANLPSGSTIKIFSVSGRLVKTMTPNTTSASWDLTTDSGDKAASGVYLYLITDSQGNKTRGKLALLR